MDTSRELRTAEVAVMAAALTRISAGVERARRQGAAHTLAVLQLVASGGPVHPTDLAVALGVHPSSVGRQVRLLKAAGHVAVTGDPADGRSCLITLTAAGVAEVDRLTHIGVQRFATFVADWDVEDVSTLGRLLLKLETSIAAVKARERAPAPPSGRAWQRTS